MTESRWNIEGMCCPNCANKIESAVGKLQGAQSVRVDFMTRSLIVSGDLTADVSIEQTVSGLGYKADLANANITHKESKASGMNLTRIFTVIATVGVAMGGIGRWLGWPDLINIPLILLSVIPGRIIFVNGFRSLMRLQLDMDFLMGAASIGAAALGEWTEAGVILILYTLSEMLEAISVERSRHELKSLMHLTPKKALRIENGSILEIDVRSLNRGDQVLIKPGATIPVDGRIISGFTSVNQASLTGESLPVDKTSGDNVLAGSINGSGAIEVTTEKAPGETMLDRVIGLITEAQASRTPLQTSIERFARYYTPAVFLVAILTAIIPPLFFSALWSIWIYRSLTLLMIACPCALVLATPVTLVSALAAAAKSGVLIKGGRFLEILSRIPVIAFDKTGTITDGRPSVSGVYMLDGIPPNEMLRRAASVELHSEHPLGKAVIERANREGLLLSTPKDFTAFPGRGAQAIVGGSMVLVGSHALFEERNLCDKRIHEVLESVEGSASTAMLVGNETGLTGMIGISDNIRPESVATVGELRQQGVRHVALLSGDNSRTCTTVGNQIGADLIHAELLPEQKIEYIRTLKQKFGSVIMVGDGVNDAPALAASDVGIGMGGTGSDAALETADIVLMGAGIGRLSWLHRLSTKSRRVIAANIGFALGVKGIFLVLAITGKATLWMALFADTGVALLVIANGLRLLREKAPVLIPE